MTDYAPLKARSAVLFHALGNALWLARSSIILDSSIEFSLWVPSLGFFLPKSLLDLYYFSNNSYKFLLEIVEIPFLNVLYDFWFCFFRKSRLPASSLLWLFCTSSSSNPGLLFLTSSSSFPLCFASSRYFLSSYCSLNASSTEARVYFVWLLVAALLLPPPVPPTAPTPAP